MDLASFNDTIELFADTISTELSSTRPLRVTNIYIKQAPSSKYLYMRLKLGSSIGSEECSWDGNTTPNIPTKDIELTISYDAFYQVPVLHYRVDEKVGFFSENSAVDTHPILQTPYMVVHACETASTMAPTRLEGVEYLKLWFAMNLSAVFPEIQLRKKKLA